MKMNIYIYHELQDELPKIYNNIFLKESLIITDYYITILKH